MPHDTHRASGPDDHFRQFMLALPFAVYTTDANGLVTAFNPAAAELAGRLPEIGRDSMCPPKAHDDGRGSTRWRWR